jgi:hypothetical protein
MFNKYVMRNRTLRQWLSGATLFENGCDIAAGVLSIVAGGLRFFS